MACNYVPGDVSKPTTRNTRHANDNVDAKGLAVEKPLDSRVEKNNLSGIIEVITELFYDLVND